jgi:pyruvyl transferase EpsO
MYTTSPHILHINAKNSSQRFSELKRALASILDFFDPTSKVIYVDYPVHTNVGDLLINLGTEQFFTDYRVPISARYSVLDMPDLSHLADDENVTFLCHGGGNFGDLYPVHQDVRESLVELFPKARIICLPQSIHYSSEEKQHISLQKFASHGNCHIFVRDRESLDILRQSHIHSSSLMPDMAHQLWDMLAQKSPVDSSAFHEDVYFLRQDQEATSVPQELVELFSYHTTVDWEDITSRWHTIMVSIVHVLIRLGKYVLPETADASLWYAVRDAVVNDAITYFSQYEDVYTNRLHAMLLALLLGHDVVAFDNSYSKLSRYIHAWLEGI